VSEPTANWSNASRASAAYSDWASQNGDGSYELKFLVPDATAEQILAWARIEMSPDPHADRTLGDGYHVGSLYFDTADLAVFHRFGSHGRRKFRLRRYGSDSSVFLERKSKSGGLVRKRRVAVPESELTNLHHAEPEQPAWPGHWFHRRLIARRLGPKCQVTYDRIARVGLTPEGPIRLTVDRCVRCRSAADLSVPCLADGAAILAGQSIVEFKFRVALPALFKGLIHELSLSPNGVSKYRLSVEACGLNNGHKAATVAIGTVDAATAERDASLRFA
jgi:hypothetical protein